MQQPLATPQAFRKLYLINSSDAGFVQGDLADPAVVRQLFQAVRENFDNRCTAFIHNAGLILGFSSKSTYEKAPVVTERTQQQLLAVSTNPDITPSDTELDE